jgi:hypothetical protein
MLDSVQPHQTKVEAFETMLKQALPEVKKTLKDPNKVAAHFLAKAHAQGLRLTLKDIKNKINPPKIPYPKEALNPEGSMLRDMTLAWAITHYASPEVFLALTSRLSFDHLLSGASRKTASRLQLAYDMSLIGCLYYLPWTLSEYYQEYQEKYEEEIGFPVQLIAPSLVLLHYKGADMVKFCLKSTTTLCQAAHEFCGEAYGYADDLSDQSTSPRLGKNG